MRSKIRSERGSSGTGGDENFRGQVKRCRLRMTRQEEKRGSYNRYEQTSRVEVETGVGWAKREKREGERESIIERNCRWRVSGRCCESRGASVGQVGSGSGRT
jgi:hypothetical protein